MRTFLLPALLAGAMAVVPALPATAQFDPDGSWRNDRGQWAYGRGERDPGRDAYEQGYRQGRLDEQRAARGQGWRQGYGRPGPYPWRNEGRFEREGLFGGLFGEREYEIDD